MYDYDDIDRALFSLQLEEPPHELRASILAATANAVPVAEPVRAFSLVELGAVGAFMAVAVWLSSVLLNGHGWPSLESSIRSLGLQLASPSVLAWLGAGASTAVWLSLANLTPRLAGVPSSRA